MDIFLAGKFVKTSKKLEVNNPFNGELIDTTFMAGEAEFEAAIHYALQAKAKMRSLSSLQRYDALMHICKYCFTIAKQVFNSFSSIFHYDVNIFGKAQAASNS